MSGFLTPNLESKGRVIRASLGLALILAGISLHEDGWWFCVFLVGCGGFTIYEAARGWCVLRACGIKTKF